MTEQRGPLTGSVNQGREALVPVEVFGSNTSLTAECVVDTGFSEQLVLPKTMVEQIGLRRWRAAQVTLGDGSDVVLSEYLAVVSWKAGRRLVQVLAVDGPHALVGTRLLADGRLTIDYPARTVEIA